MAKKTTISCVISIILTQLLILCSCENNSTEKSDPAKCEHNFIDVLGAPPTCTESGKTDGSECSECGLVLLPQAVIEPLGHSYKDGVCEVCNAEQYESKGLEYSSYGNGTCCILSIGACTDEQVIIPSKSPNGDTVISIAKDAFKYSNITQVSLPNTLSEIGESAFWGCTVDTVVLPEKLKRIESYAFCLSKLKSISFNDSLEYIGDSAFANTLLENVILTESVKEIGSRAFYNCVNLKLIDLECSVQFLSVATFAQNYALESITLPNSIASLSYREFEDCTNLNSITLGSELASIEKDTFSGCSALRTICFTGTRARWNSVTKPYGWDSDLINYEVVCTDD